MLDELINTDYDWKPLFITGILNTDMEHHITMFHRLVENGDQYLSLVHEAVAQAMHDHKPLPVVRFADAEFFFYSLDMRCNGLYLDARSTDDMQKVMPHHIQAMKQVSETGKMAILNWQNYTWYGDNQPKVFMEFLAKNGVQLHDSYIPFYMVYAYLTSKLFHTLINKAKICMISNGLERNCIEKWFGRHNVSPELTLIEIPPTYAATDYPNYAEDILKQIPADTQLALVGAAVGAVMVCADVSSRCNIPCLDAGAVLNLMNDKEYKSGDHRAYTDWTP